MRLGVNKNITPSLLTFVFAFFIQLRMNLTGSVAIITGGARGIGKAITAALLQNKAKVKVEAKFSGISLQHWAASMARNVGKEAELSNS